jgi:hypothetical protein
MTSNPNWQQIVDTADNVACILLYSDAKNCCELKSKKAAVKFMTEHMTEAVVPVSATWTHIYVTSDKST